MLPEVPQSKRFATLEEAFNWVVDLQRAGHILVASRIWSDYFTNCKPRDKYVTLLGVAKKADKLCQKMAPGGYWTVDLGKGLADELQFMTWYSKFLPYAYAMVQSEDGFECHGLQYENINAYFRTVMGYIAIGTNDIDCAPIEDEDHRLFSRIYNASGNLWSPGLPYDEVMRPCAVFVAYRAPALFCRAFKHYPGKYFHHAVEVLEALDLEVPQKIKNAIKRGLLNV